jgi:hypothetical protein
MCSRPTGDVVEWLDGLRIGGTRAPCSFWWLYADLYGPITILHIAEVSVHKSNIDYLLEPDATQD